MAAQDSEQGVAFERAAQDGLHLEIGEGSTRHGVDDDQRGSGRLRRPHQVSVEPDHVAAHEYGRARLTVGEVNPGFLDRDAHAELDRDGPAHRPPRDLSHPGGPRRREPEDGPSVGHGVARVPAYDA
ncbi:MAG: hypothetical protein R2695_04295 [Acidimicrobiales bacterium]